MYESETDKLLKADVEFWKSMAKEQHDINNKLMHQLTKYRIAVKEYKEAARMLSMSGDNVLDYEWIGDDYLAKYDHEGEKNV